MIKLLFVAVVALLCSSFAAPDPGVASSQSTSQSPEQAELARLSATVVDLYKQGKYDEAMPIAKRVLEIEQGLGAQRPAVAVALANLAELYFAKKKDGDAENLFQQAAAIYEENQINTPPVSSVLERLAQLNFLKRKYDSVIALLERSLAIRGPAFGAESLQVSQTLHELGNVYQVKGQFMKAEELYLRSIAILEKTLGRTDSTTVNAMKDYACLSVKNIQAFLSRDKPKDDADLPDAEKARRSVAARASCWLYGFKQNCQDESYVPRLNISKVLNGRAVRLVQPPYPSAAREKRLSGRVFIAVQIDEDGNVIQAKPVCGGYPELNQAGLAAAQASKFTPTKLDNKLIQVTGIIHYNFVVQ